MSCANPVLDGSHETLRQLFGVRVNAIFRKIDAYINASMSERPHVLQLEPPALIKRFPALKKRNFCWRNLARRVGLNHSAYASKKFTSTKRRKKPQSQPRRQFHRRAVLFLTVPLDLLKDVSGLSTLCTGVKLHLRDPGNSIEIRGFEAEDSTCYRHTVFSSFA